MNRMGHSILVIEPNVCLVTGVAAGTHLCCYEEGIKAEEALSLPPICLVLSSEKNVRSYNPTPSVRGRTIPTLEKGLGGKPD